MTETLIQWWRTLALRERRMVIAAAAVVALAFVYLLCFEPAWTGRTRIAAQLPGLRSQVAQMEAMSAEARRLTALPAAGGQPPAVRQQLEASISEAGLQPFVSQLTSSGELLDVRFKNVPFAKFLDWLAAAQRDTRLRVVDASVQREATGGAVTARIAFESPRREGG